MYPFELVVLLLKAVRENQRLQIISETFSMTIAVMHSLDVGFNGGKGKILTTWLDDMSATKDDKSEKPVKQLFTERTQSFFDSLPKTTKKKKGE